LPDEPQSDAQLMAAVASGDISAWGELIRRHQVNVLALATRTLRRADLAEDVAQDVFVKVYRGAKTYRPTAKFTTWLYRIVVNRCLDVLRRNKRRIFSIDQSPPPARAETTGSLEQRERAETIRRAVDRLPERQRMVVILHRYQDLSHREVAQTTGWSVSAVESLLVRAYENLRQSLAGL
jgi:RNA polymerase sigma-70 factor (ECF subfamily)